MQTTSTRALVSVVTAWLSITGFSSTTPAFAAGSQGKESELYVSGGITTVVQKIKSSAPDVVGNFGSALSVDIFLEKTVYDGKALIYLNHSQGYDPLPATNGDYEGPSGGKPGDATYDEGFSDTRIAEAFYEAPLTSALTVTVGMISPQRYFDNNAVASDQTRQFLSTPLVNNSAIEFPGQRPIHAYPGGIRLSAPAGKHVMLQGALFEDAQDYTGTFGHTFVIAEADLAMGSADATTNLRFITWKSNKYQTRGSALSADHNFGENFSVFVRYGKKSLPTTPPSDITADELTSSLKTALSAGGQAIIRGRYTVGVGYCAETPNTTTLKKDTWIETYVSYEINNSVHLTVDYQSIKNKIFGQPIDQEVASASVVAGRLQVDF